MQGQTISGLIRENVYVALFNLLQTAANFTTVGRKAVTVADLVSEQYPAMFIVETTQNAQPHIKGMPTKWVLNVDVLIYVTSLTGGLREPLGAETVVPATQLNKILDSMEAVLKPSPVTGTLTLGGLCEHCWIEGEVITDEGMLFPEGMALVPVKILVTS